MERRDLLYNLSGRSWDQTDLSISFVPDGTSWEQGPAFTYQALGQTASPDVWKETAARSFQLWANVTPLNFRFVADDGAQFGAAGDHGDIRVAVGESWAGAAHAILPELGEMSGEITFGANFDYDTRTTDGGFARLLVHEMGHSLGLLHEHHVPAAMRGLGYFGITADDIAGIQAIYGARQH
ncbi:MAG: matrixin family metalloprotease, partial [Planctomycetota bacterium]